MVLYTNFMPKRFDGFNIGLVTLIRPAFRNDAGLHAHEAVHRAQFMRNPLMGLFYLCSKKHRFAYEVEAYREQLKFAPSRAALFAHYLISNYDLSITLQEAIAALEAPV